MRIMRIYLLLLLGISVAFHDVNAREDRIQRPVRGTPEQEPSTPAFPVGAGTLDWPGWLPAYSLPMATSRFRQAYWQPGGVVWVNALGVYAHDRLLRSDDNGKTWTEALARSEDDLTCFAAWGDMVAVVGTEYGELLRTSDGGSTWNGVYSGNRWINGIAFIGPDTVIAHADADGQGFIVLRSTDGGATWSRLTNLPSQEQAGGWSISNIYPHDVFGSTMWISIGGAYGSWPTRILRTTDAGESWSSWEIDLDGGQGYLWDIWTLRFADDSVGYLAAWWDGGGFDNLRLQKTTDGGLTWGDPIPIDPAIPETDADVTFMIPFRGTDSLLAVGYQWRQSYPLASWSADGGLSWTPMHPSGTQDLWCAAFQSPTDGLVVGARCAYRYSPSQPQKFLSSTPFWSDFADTQVGQQSSPVDVVMENIGTDAVAVTDLLFPSGNFAVSGAPALPLTLQSGESVSFTISFSPQERGEFRDSIVIVSDDPETPRRLISLSGRGYTMDLVERTLMYAVSVSEKLYSVNPTTGASLELADFPGGSPTTLAVRKKTDVLHTWINGSIYQVGAQSADLVEALESSISGTVNAIAFDGGDALYAGLQDGKLHKINVETGEETLIGTATGYNITGLACDPAGDFLWAAARKFPFGRLDFILKISTADATPTIVGNTGDNVPTKSLAFDNAGNLYGLKQKGGTDLLVQFDKSTGVLVDSVDIGTLGLEAITMWYDVVVGIEEERSVPLQYHLAQNYPNPFNPSTTIAFSIPERNHVALRVYNMLGQEVSVLLDGIREAGHHEVVFDASGLASGIYFYRITAGEYLDVRKMMLVR